MCIVLEAQCLAGERVEVDTSSSYVCWKVQTWRGFRDNLRSVLWVYEKASIRGARCQLNAMRSKQNDIINSHSKEEVLQDVRADFLWEAAEPVFSRRHIGESLFQTHLPHKYTNKSWQRWRAPTKSAVDADNWWITEDVKQSNHQPWQAHLRQLLLSVQGQ